MRYDRIYRQALDKVTASDRWKADTRAKMAAASRPRLQVWRRALPVAAAAAVCLTAALSLALAGGPGAVAPATGEAGSAAPSLAAQPAPAAIAPRTAPADGRMVPAFSVDDLREVEPPAEAAALLEGDTLPDALPVWRVEGDSLVRLEDFPSVPPADALAQAGLDPAARLRLVYLESGGYVLPAWKLDAEGEGVYLPAIAGQ